VEQVTVKIKIQLIYNHLTPWSRVLPEKLIVMLLVKKLEPEGSQEPATGPYPQPDESSSHPLTLFHQDPFSYYPPIYA
jgi:hypothetical protein